MEADAEGGMYLAVVEADGSDGLLVLDRRFPAAVQLSEAPALLKAVLDEAENRKTAALRKALHQALQDFFRGDTLWKQELERLFKSTVRTSSRSGSKPAGNDQGSGGSSQPLDGDRSGSDFIRRISELLRKQ